MIESKLNIDKITGQPYSHNGKKAKDGFYVKCPKCKKSKLLRSDIHADIFLSLYKYPVKYPQQGLGLCKACDTPYKDVIFAVYNEKIMYVLIKRNILISKKLLYIDKDFHDKIYKLISKDKINKETPIDFIKRIRK